MNKLPNSNEKRFFYNTPGWHVWHKPAGCKIIFIWAHGAGGGGGGGAGSNTGTLIGGSGGAGGNGHTVLVNAWTIPDVLYIYVGAGGAGGAGHTNSAGGANGTAGEETYIGFTSGNTNQSNCIVRPTGGNGGNVASTTGGTAGGAADANFLISNVRGTTQNSTYKSGTGGGSGNNSGNNFTWSSNVLRSAGLGGTGGAGAGTTPAVRYGGAYSGSTNSAPFPVSANGAASYGTEGQSGFLHQIDSRLWFRGGIGGNNSQTTGVAGGRGGDGGPGCGGGGGGAHLFEITTAGGAGGKGGDGFVFIICK